MTWEETKEAAVLARVAQATVAAAMVVVVAATRAAAPQGMAAKAGVS